MSGLPATVILDFQFLVVFPKTFSTRYTIEEGNAGCRLVQHHLASKGVIVGNNLRIRTCSAVVEDSVPTFYQSQILEISLGPRSFAFDPWQTELRIILEAIESIHEQGIFITTTPECSMKLCVATCNGQLNSHCVRNSFFMATALGICFDELRGSALRIQSSHPRKSFNLLKLLKDLFEQPPGQAVELLAMFGDGLLALNHVMLANPHTLLFPDFQASLDIYELTSFITVIFTIVNFCHAGEDDTMLDLVLGGIDDNSFHLPQLVAAIHCPPHFQAFYANKVTRCQPDFTANAIRTIAAPWMFTPLYTFVRRITTTRFEDSDATRIRTAIIHKFIKGGYGLDTVLIVKAPFPNMPEMEYIAPSIELRKDGLMDSDDDEGHIDGCEHEAIALDLRGLADALPGL